MKSPIHTQLKNGGFSLVELMVAVVIVGILGAVALPQYFNQVQKTRQNEAATQLSQVQTTIAAFVDEMGLLPTSWKDLDKITPLMTPAGPANETNFGWISIASSGCTEKVDSNCYTVKAVESDQVFTLQAKSANSDAKNYNVVACLDLRTGASDLKKGTSGGKADPEELRCRRKTS